MAASRASMCLALLLVLGVSSTARATAETTLQRRSLLQTYAYPAIDTINCTSDVTIPRKPFGFDVISALAPVLSEPALAIDKLNAEYGVPVDCAELTGFNTPLFSCLDDLSLEEGCCDYACYDAVTRTMADPKLGSCFGYLTTTLCKLRAKDSRLNTTLLPLQQALGSVIRRCATGVQIDCDAVNGVKKSPPPLATSPPPAPVLLVPPPRPSPPPGGYVPSGNGTIINGTSNGTVINGTSNATGNATYGKRRRHLLWRGRRQWTHL